MIDKTYQVTKHEQIIEQSDMIKKGEVLHACVTTFGCCSNCGYRLNWPLNAGRYCINCGAKLM